MEITLDGTLLCSDDARSTDGAPAGPCNLSINENPGIVQREYIGADRIAADEVQCHHGTISFEAVRIFATSAEAVAYALTGHRSEPVAGVLKFGDETIFTNAGITNKRLGVNGCSVAVIYTIEG